MAKEVGKLCFGILVFHYSQLAGGLLAVTLKVLRWIIIMVYLSSFGDSECPVVCSKVGLTGLGLFLFYREKVAGVC